MKNFLKYMIWLILVILLIWDIKLKLELKNMNSVNESSQSNYAEKKEENEQVQTNAVSFKRDYERLNGTSLAVTIPEDNPFEVVEAKDIVQKIKNKETFFVYFGFASCPWCRISIETAMKVAKENNVDKIYYVDISDIRDDFHYEDGKLVKTKEGTADYFELLTLLDDVLLEYNINMNNDGEIVKLNEKRIMAPNYIYVQDGNAIRLISGTSTLQKSPDEPLTEEVRNDLEQQFTELFSVNKVD